MTIVTFDIQVWNIASGIQVLVTGGSNPGLYTHSQASLTGEVGFSLFPTGLSPTTLLVDGTGFSPGLSAINLPADVANQPSLPGTCCEIKNSTQFQLSVPVALYGAVGLIVSDSVPAGQSLYFIVQSPPEATGFSRVPCCVAEGTPLETPDGRLVRIQDLRPGDEVLDFQRRPVAVNRLIRFDVPTRNFVQLGQLRICRDHPVLDGDLQERPCQEAEGAEAITLASSLPVYTLVTEHKAYVLMQEQAVATWSERAWRATSATLPSYREL